MATETVVAPTRRNRQKVADGIGALTMKRLIFACVIAPLLSGAAVAQSSASVPDSAMIDACRATGLVALKERSPSIKDLVLDMDSLVVAKANTNVEGTPIRTIIMGEAYLERKEAGNNQRFLCLIGEKGKVLLTFFTAQ
jgi:hypothetical protein